MISKVQTLVSVIIPALNEAANIAACVEAARDGYAHGQVEIIVVDGGSTDGTQALVPADVVMVEAPRGRGVQMNRGAALAQGDVLVFCHADTRLPMGWREAVIDILSDRKVSGGGFQRIFEPARGFVHIINRIKIRDNWRLLHGDRAQFMSRSTFEAVGGFPEIPLMEDVEMGRLLHEQGKIRIVPLPLQVSSSSRRLLERGPFRQYCLTGWYRFRYFHLGATPDDIAQAYRSSREDLGTGSDSVYPAAADSRGRGKGPWIAVLLLAVSFVAPLIWPLIAGQHLVNTERLQTFIRNAGPWAPLVYAVVYTISSPIPGIAPFLSPMAGLLFGLGWGLALVLAIAPLSSLIPFSIARKLGRTWVASKVEGGKLEDLYEQSETQIGFIFVLLLRLIPVLPWELQNYVAGVTKVGVPTYLLATVLGILPGSTSFVLLGESVAEGAPWKSAVAIALDTGVIILVSIIAAVFRRRAAKRPPRAEIRQDDAGKDDNQPVSDDID